MIIKLTIVKSFEFENYAVFGAWHIKLRQNQVLPLCSEAEEGIPP